MTLLPHSRRRGGRRTRHGSITIAAPPDKVWDLITTVGTIPEWYDAWDTVESDTSVDAVGLGTEFRLFRQRRNGRDIAWCRVTDVSAGTRLQWEQSEPGRPTVLVTFDVVSDAEGATELHNTRTWTGAVTARSRR